MRSENRARGWLLASLVPFALCSGGPSAAHVQAGAFDALSAQELRLASVGYRLAHASEGSCARPMPLTGFVVHDLSEYDPDLREDVAQNFGLKSGFGILAVVPGSPAQRAGLQVKDEILAIDGTDVQDQDGRKLTNHASFDRMTAFSSMLDTKLAAGPVRLTVRRGGSILALQLDPVFGCSGRFDLSLSHTLNAWSDGDYVVLTTAILDFSANDDELAFVIAHEMSHNILGHGDTPRADANALFSTAPRKKLSGKGMEVQADAYAVQLMAGAGYDPEHAIPFLLRAGKRRWWDFAPLDHPGTKRRIQTIRSVWAQVQAARQTQDPGNLKSAEIAPPLIRPAHQL